MTTAVSGSVVASVPGVSSPPGTGRLAPISRDRRLVAPGERLSLMLGLTKRSRGDVVAFRDRVSWVPALSDTADNLRERVSPGRPFRR